MQLLPWLLALLIGAVAVYFIMGNGTFQGQGSVDARGSEASRHVAPDDPDDVMSRSIGDAVGAAFRFADAWSRKNG